LGIAVFKSVLYGNMYCSIIPYCLNFSLACYELCILSCLKGG